MYNQLIRYSRSQAQTAAEYRHSQKQPTRICLQAQCQVAQLGPFILCVLPHPPTPIIKGGDQCRAASFLGQTFATARQLRKARSPLGRSLLSRSLKRAKRSSRSLLRGGRQSRYKPMRAASRSRACFISLVSSQHHAACHLLIWLMQRHACWSRISLALSRLLTCIARVIAASHCLPPACLTHASSLELSHLRLYIARVIAASR